MLALRRRIAPDPRLQAIAESFPATLFLDFRAAYERGFIVNEISGEVGQLGFTGKLTREGYVGGANINQIATFASNFGLTSSNGYLIIVGVTLPSTSENGAFLRIGSSVAVGVGNTTFDDTGNNVIMLYEGLSWLPTSTTYGTRFNIVVIDRKDNTASYQRAYLNGDDTDITGASFGGSIIAPDATTDFGGYSTRVPRVTIHFVIAGPSADQTTGFDTSVPNIINPLIRAYMPATESVWEPRAPVKRRRLVARVAASGGGPLMRGGLTKGALIRGGRLAA